MKTIKYLSEKVIKLDGVKYKPYFIGELPSTFAFIYDRDSDKEGVTKWFNYKGFTYIKL